MSAENKALIRRLIEEVWNQKNLGVVEQIIAANYVMHDPATPGIAAGIAGFKSFHRLYTSAFPDQHFAIKDLIAEGDRVVTRWEVEGTHTGELANIAPTGKRVRVSGTTITRVENGKIAEDHVFWDALGLMQQLGVVQKSASA